MIIDEGVERRLGLEASRPTRSWILEIVQPKNCIFRRRSEPNTESISSTMHQQVPSLKGYLSSMVAPGV